MALDFNYIFFYLWVFVLTLFLSRFIFSRYIGFAKRYNLVKAQSARASHKGQVFTGGGVVLAAVIMVATLVLHDLDFTEFSDFSSVIATSKSQLTSFLIAIALSTGAGFFFLTTEFAEPAIAAELTEQSDMDFSEDIPWQPFSDENIDALKADKKAIFIDFTADWCLSCKVNEKNVLETETIRMAMSRHI